MKKNLFITLFVFVFTIVSHAQWSLKISSNVELRTWKLSSKAEKDEKGLANADIVLTQGSKIISQSKSEPNGDFTVLIPPDGDYILTVSFAGCNSKKFSINTQGVPENIATENFKPSFSIGGFVMAKPFPGINYTGLQQTLVKIEYFSNSKKFDSNDNVTENGLNIVSKIAEDENTLIDAFCSTNKAADAALTKPDCPLAKSLYEKAITIIPGEQYPVDQLVKVGLCIKDKEAAEKKAAADIAAKENAEKEALEKKAAVKKAEELRLAKTVKENAEKRAIEKKLLAEAKAKEEQAQLAKITKERAVNESSVATKPKTETSIKTTSPAKPTHAKVTAKEPEKKALIEAKSTINTEESKTKKRNSDYSIPQVLGLNKYTEAIKKADELFKMKRYKEAKIEYEEALKQRANDPYATSKLNAIEKMIAPK